MRALFITTRTNDCDNHVAAWDAVSDEPAARVTFDHMGINNAWQLVEAAAEIKPGVIFYIGPHKASGIPRVSEFRQLREIAPLINFCSDAGDRPWHVVLSGYAEADCFDLQVGIDGCLNAPVDLVTLTPVDFRAFEGKPPKRDIRCGFSGSPTGQRGDALAQLGSRVMVRCRGDDYADHVGFLRRSRMALNVSWMGSGRGHHVKGRAVEAGWAGCALLEFSGSPLGHWYPQGTYLPYDTIDDAARIIDDTPDDVIAETALALSDLVRARFHPAMIYGEILEKAGVGNPFKIAPQY